MPSQTGKPFRSISRSRVPSSVETTHSLPPRLPCNASSCSLRLCWIDGSFAASRSKAYSLSTSSGGPATTSCDLASTIALANTGVKRVQFCWKLMPPCCAAAPTAALGNTKAVPSLPWAVGRPPIAPSFLLPDSSLALPASKVTANTASRLRSRAFCGSCADAAISSLVSARCRMRTSSILPVKLKPAL